MVDVPGKDLYIMATNSPQRVLPLPSQSFSIKLLATLACFAVLYIASSLFIPIGLALVLSLTLFPFIRAGERIRVPPVISAMAVMLVVTVAIGATVIALSGPVSQLSRDAPEIGRQLKAKFNMLREPLESINQAGKQVEEITSEAKEPLVQEVIIKQRGLVARASDEVVAVSASSLLIFTLTLFLLMSRDLFYLKVVRVMPTLSDKKRALQAAYDIERDVSRYLLTVSVINAGLGAAVGLSLWALGMPNPLLWGVMAAALNFLPYLGALGGIVITGMVALISFDTLGQAIAVPAVYLLLTVIEGQFVTPYLLGRRFSLNVVVILISIAFWGFLWGAVGVFVAVPFLIILKVLCEHVEGMANLGEFLSGEEAVVEPEVAKTSSA
jgi:predicted PurR-regulated permease PerM